MKRNTNPVNSGFNGSRAGLEKCDNPLAAFVSSPPLAAMAAAKEAAEKSVSFSPGGELSPMMLKASMFKVCAVCPPL